MLDIGVTKIAIIGAIALVVIGPERLPGLARTLGTLLGRARSYMADVKAEVDRSMALDELKKMKESVQSAAQEVEQSMRTGVSELESVVAEAAQLDEPPALDGPRTHADAFHSPQYRHPNKRWRLKQGAVPQWYKARMGVRTKALSGAARVARFRPYKPH